MKIRLDYVTNSSSSSFLISTKGKLTDKQKDIIVEEFLKVFNDISINSNTENPKEELLEAFDIEEDEWIAPKAIEALENGYDIHYSSISDTFDFTSLLDRILNRLEAENSDNLKVLLADGY